MLLTFPFLFMKSWLVWIPQQITVNGLHWRGGILSRGDFLVGDFVGWILSKGYFVRVSKFWNLDSFSNYLIQLLLYILYHPCGACRPKIHSSWHVLVSKWWSFPHAKKAWRCLCYFIIRSHVVISYGRSELGCYKLATIAQHHMRPWNKIYLREWAENCSPKCLVTFYLCRKQIHLMISGC